MSELMYLLSPQERRGAGAGGAGTPGWGPARAPTRPGSRRPPGPPGTPGRAGRGRASPGSRAAVVCGRGRPWRECARRPPAAPPCNTKSRFSYRLRVLHSRVADPVHFRPDPDPANQNFETGSRILLALTKNQLKHQIFFHVKHISSDIWMMIIFTWKNGKIHLKMCKTSSFKIFFHCSCNFTLPKYR